MLDALVRQLPGATLSTDGVIEVNGRKINELLVNGKDFFKGDPKVALQNLPAYTVKNLQGLRQSRQRRLSHPLQRTPRSQGGGGKAYVMDVVLKKNTTPAIRPMWKEATAPSTATWGAHSNRDIPTSSA